MRRIPGRLLRLGPKIRPPTARDVQLRLSSHNDTDMGRRFPLGMIGQASSPAERQVVNLTTSMSMISLECNPNLNEPHR